MGSFAGRSSLVEQRIGLTHPATARRLALITSCEMGHHVWSTCMVRRVVTGKLRIVSVSTQ